MICNFCERDQQECNILIEGPNGLHICDECATACNTIIKACKYAEELMSDKVAEEETVLNYTPKEIVEKLDEYVISQDLAKKALAVGVYNHYKKLKLAKDNIQIQKSNMLILGPTGTGKTYLLKTISTILNVPFITIDTSQLTPRGYKGRSLNDEWAKLFMSCVDESHSTKLALSKMQKAIVYFDEIDKLVPNGSFNKNESTKNFYSIIQTELLKSLEDSELSFTVSTSMGEQELTVNTANMLFIFGGAFSGIDEIVKKRLGVTDKKTIGFGNYNETAKEDTTNYITKVDPDDLLEYGLMPEFLGRVSSIVCLEPLSVVDLSNILTKPKNNLVEQYKRLFLVDGVKLKFDKAAVTRIAEKAIEKKTGARGLKSIIETNMLDLMYEIPSDKTISSCTITADFIDGTAPAKITHKKTKSNVYKLTQKEESITNEES